MGAIQQAFNQAMTTGAYFAQPMAQKKKEIKTAEQGAEQATKLLEEASEKGKGEEIDIATERFETAHQRLFELSPTKKTLSDYRIAKEQTEANREADLEKKEKQEKQNREALQKKEIKRSINEEMGFRGLKGVSEFRGVDADQRLMIKAISELEQERFKPTVREVIKTR